jgi:hypothetical protein
MKWEGRVTSVDREAGIFTAGVVPLQGSETNFEGEFVLDCLSESETQRVRPGSVIYVTVRVTRDRARRTRRETTVRLQRLGRWSQAELDEFLKSSRERHEADADLFD